MYDVKFFRGRHAMLQWLNSQKDVEAVSFIINQTTGSTELLVRDTTPVGDPNQPSLFDH